MCLHLLFLPVSKLQSAFSFLPLCAQLIMEVRRKRKARYAPHCLDDYCGAGTHKHLTTAGQIDLCLMQSKSYAQLLSFQRRNLHLEYDLNADSDELLNCSSQRERGPCAIFAMSWAQWAACWRGLGPAFFWMIENWLQKHCLNARRIHIPNFLWGFFSGLGNSSFHLLSSDNAPSYMEKSECVKRLSTPTSSHPSEKEWWISEKKIWKHNKSYLSLLTHECWGIMKNPFLSLSL